MSSAADIEHSVNSILCQKDSFLERLERAKGNFEQTLSILECLQKYSSKHTTMIKTEAFGVHNTTSFDVHGNIANMEYIKELEFSWDEDSIWTIECKLTNNSVNHRFGNSNNRGKFTTKFSLREDTKLRSVTLYFSKKSDLHLLTFVELFTSDGEWKIGCEQPSYFQKHEYVFESPCRLIGLHGCAGLSIDKLGFYY